MKMLMGVMICVCLTMTCLAHETDSPGEIVDQPYYQQLLEDGLVRPGTWADEVVRNNVWEPCYPELYNDFSIEKMDSLVNLCDSLISTYYGPRDSIIGKCEVFPIDYQELPDEFNILGIVCRKIEILKIGYGSISCNNPLRRIEWYHRYKRHITPKIYRCMDFVYMLFYHFYHRRMESSNIDIGLKYNNDENRRWALFMKNLNLKMELDDLIEKGVPEDKFVAVVTEMLYDIPFHDEEAELYDGAEF